MNANFERVIEGIYRLKVPFDTLYTSVFLVKSEGGAIMVDCATTDYDVDEIILPALRDFGCKTSEIGAVVVTHSHVDHAGGLSRIKHHAPNIDVIREVRPIYDGLEVYPLYGHADDMIGLFDPCTGTLISGDGLQGAGVDKYRTSVANKAAYFETIERIRRDKRVENLIFSHAYEPWFKDSIFGREGVLDVLDECKKYILGD